MTEITLGWKFALVIAGLLFNAGLTIGGGLYLFKNHMAHVAKELATIKRILCAPTTGVVERLARLEERVKKK